MKKEILLGATKDHVLVFGEVEVTTRNGYKEFTANFSTVRPFNSSDVDLEEHAEMYIDGLPKEELYNLCEKYDCKPSELPEELANEYELTDFIDCSLYSNYITIGKDDWYFETVACGQCDTRKEGMEQYTNKGLYDSIHYLWDNYHLGKITEDIEKKVENIIEAAKAIDEEEWITNYIKVNLIEN